MTCLARTLIPSCSNYLLKLTLAYLETSHTQTAHSFPTILLCYAVTTVPASSEPLSEDDPDVWTVYSSFSDIET